jgi:hypothetical protein
MVEANCCHQQPVVELSTPTSPPQALNKAHAAFANTHSDGRLVSEGKKVSQPTGTPNLAT